MKGGRDEGREGGRKAGQIRYRNLIATASPAGVLTWFVPSQTHGEIWSPEQELRGDGTFKRGLGQRD